MLGGREPVVDHGHSHAIPASVPGDSGFEVSSFGLRPDPPPRQLSEAFSSFSPSLSTQCLRASQWASRTIQSKTILILLLLPFLFLRSVWLLFIAISAHKYVISFCISMQFVTSGLPPLLRLLIGLTQEEIPNFPSFPNFLSAWTESYSPASSTSPHLPSSPRWERALASSYQRL